MKKIKIFLSIILISNFMASSYAAGPVNNSGSNYSETDTKNNDKNFGQIKEGTAPTCYDNLKTGSWYETNDNGTYNKNITINDYFIKPFPGCYGYKWTENIKNCLTGTIAWRFYGNLTDPAQAITLSKAGTRSPCESNIQAGLLYPNPMDSGISYTDIGVIKSINKIGSEIYELKGNNNVITTGNVLSKKDRCNDNFINNENFKNRLGESLNTNSTQSIKDELYKEYKNEYNKTQSLVLASLHINHNLNVNITSANDISFGSLTDCSSIYDYQQYIETGFNKQYKTYSEVPQQLINQGTVVLGTCAIATERPARIYQKNSKELSYAFYGDRAESGMLTERYSKIETGLKNKKTSTTDPITQKYKNAIIENYYSGLPKGYINWPKAADINKQGSTAWNNLKEATKADIDRFLLENLDCTYTKLEPTDRLIGCPVIKGNSSPNDPCKPIGPTPSPSPSPEPDISAPSSGVYIEISTQLPKFFTASGELKRYNIESESRVLCDGRTCKTSPEICDPGSCPIPDPVIVSHKYETDLIGVNGYRECRSKSERKCDFYASNGSKMSDISAIFFSPSAKGEYVKLGITAPLVRYIPQKYVEFCSPIVVGVDPKTGEDIMGCQSKFRLVQEKEVAGTQYYHKKGSENKGVTGSSGS